MVNFGERLKEMRRPGWEAHYIDYNALKMAIERLERNSPAEAEAASNQFLASLTRQIKNMDDFISQKTEQLNSEYLALTVTSATSTLEERKTSLECSISNLRQFVGTNVIAATKIVKKHDKQTKVVHDKALQKRDAVGALIRGCASFAALSSLSEELGQGSPRSVVQIRNAAPDGDEDDI